MINCKNHVGNAQSVAELTCFTKKIQEVRACGISRLERCCVSLAPASNTSPTHWLLLTTPPCKHFQGEWVHVYVRLSAFAVHLKLSQC